MDVTDLEISALHEAPWNPNIMDEAMMSRLRESLSRYGIVEPLVVRPIKEVSYEVLSGNQRLKVVKEMGTYDVIPCVVVNLDDAEAMLLAQALNRVHGEDDPAMKGAMLREILSKIPENKVVSLLPESAEGLRSLASIGQDDLAQHLQAWQRSQAARLHHVQLQFTDKQLETVEEAVRQIMPEVMSANCGNPNNRSTAIYLVCEYYLEKGDRNE